MPDNRMLHRMVLRNDDIASLTDFERGVWMAYLLLADDYGVMRASGISLQHASWLENRPRKTVERALDELVRKGLLRRFAHQGRHYVFHPRWQKWQSVRYPRPTIEPCPPPEALAECDSDTAELFQRHARKDAEPMREDSRKVSEKLRSLPCAGVREEANANGLGLTHTANAPDDFAQFWEAYPRRVGKGAAEAAWKKHHPPLDAVLVAIGRQRLCAQWLKDGGAFIPHPSTWINQHRWLDEPDNPTVPQMSGLTRQLAQASEEFLRDAN